LSMFITHVSSVIYRRSPFKCRRIIIRFQKICAKNLFFT